MRVDVGSRHLTPTGLPVQVAEIHTSDMMVLQSLVSDNRIAVPPGYPLYPMGRRGSAFETRANPYTLRPKRAETIIPKPYKPLAPLIDAMLLAGNKTMRGIVREIKRKAGAQCKGKDIRANVRARIYWLRKRNHRVEKNRQAHIQVIPN